MVKPAFGGGVILFGWSVLKLFEVSKLYGIVSEIEMPLTHGKGTV